MAQTIKLKRGTTTPTTSNIVSGEVAIDTSAQKLYINDAGTIKEIGGGGGISNVVEDTTPQLGGGLDLNGNDITGTGNIDVTGTVTTDGLTTSADINIESTTALVNFKSADGATLFGDIRGTTTGLDIRSSESVDHVVGGNFVTNSTSSAFSVYQPTAIIGTSPSFRVATDAFYVDGVNSRVGIGTTSPSTALEVQGTIKADIVSLNDNDEITFGTSNDLKIYHDGSHSYIAESGTGDLRIQSTNLYLQDKDGANYVGCIDGGQVSLYHNGALKLSTASYGIAINGSIAAVGGSSTNWNTAYGWGDHSTQGYLTSITGQSIENLSDVNAMTPTDGQVLTWDNANSRWDAADPSGGGLTQAKSTAISLIFG